MKTSLIAGKDVRSGSSLKMFAQEEIKAIHNATLQVLSDVGMAVYHDEALDILEAGGANVNRTDNVVKFPPYLVEECLNSAPGRVLFAGRNPEHDVILEGRRVGFTNGGCAVMVDDPYTGKTRESTKADVANIAKVCDALENVDITSGAVVARDVPEIVSDLHEAEAFLTNTTKHCHHINLVNAREFIEMGAVIAGGMEELRKRPIISALVCSVSPLQLHTEKTDIIIEFAKAGIPVNILSMAMAGASAPITLAGALVMNNAEVLGGIVLHQLTAKGAPVLYGQTTTTFDMFNSTAPMGAPEIGMVGAALAEMAHFYNLPVWVAGCWTDSKISDPQAGHEKTINALTTALAGANMIYGMGMLDLGTTISLEQLVIDNEIVKMVRRNVAGITIDDVTLAVDLITKVGIGNDFLNQRHTLDYMETEQSKASIFDRNNREAWEKEGGKDVVAVAHEKFLNILKTHKPEALPDDVLNKLKAIIANAENKEK